MSVIFAAQCKDVRSVLPPPTAQIAPADMPCQELHVCFVPHLLQTASIAPIPLYVFSAQQATISMPDHAQPAVHL